MCEHVLQEPRAHSSVCAWPCAGVLQWSQMLVANWRQTVGDAKHVVSLGEDKDGPLPTPTSLPWKL